MRSSYKFLLTALLFCVSCNAQILITSPSPIIRTMIPHGIQSKVLMWGKHDTMNDVTTKVVLAEPKDGCEPYTNPDKTGKTAFFIAKGGKCSLGTKIHNAQSAGAAALFIQYERDNLDEILLPDHINGKIAF